MTGSGEYTAVPERSMREKQAVASVAWLFLWELRHAAKAKWSAQSELHAHPKEEIKTRKRHADVIHRVSL